MKKAMLLASMLAVVMMATSPAIAQQPVQESRAIAAGEPLPPDFVVEDGVVTIGGDVQTSCDSFAFTLEDGFDQGLSPAQQQQVLEQCQAQGFLTPEMSALPDTGGPAFATLAVGLVLAGFGSLLLKRRMN